MASVPRSRVSACISEPAGIVDHRAGRRDRTGRGGIANALIPSGQMGIGIARDLRQSI